MALRLQIISDQRQALGDRARIVFGVGGGSIGRAIDNDWVLPDRHRYLSAHHARILFRDGTYLLEDTSTNGVYLNHAAAPIGRNNTYVIRDGDILRLGEYQLRARLDPADAQGPLSTSILAPDRVARPKAGAAARAPGSDDSAPSLNLEDLLFSDGIVPPRPAAVDAESPEPRFERARATARARLEGRTQGTFDARAGLQSFGRGAGIDIGPLAPEADLRRLQLAGQLLREAILGLQDILRAQRAFRLQNHIETPAMDVDGPALDTTAASDYLLRMLDGHENHEFDAILLLRSYFAAARRHDMALRPALRGALDAFLSHLQPEGIASRTAAKGIATAPWDLYREIFRSLTQSPDGHLPHLFGEALGEAYLKALKDPDPDR